MDTWSMYRQLKNAYSRGAVGVDLLTVPPVNEAGNTCLIVIVVFYAKCVWATPAKEYSAHTVAVASHSFVHSVCTMSCGLIPDPT